MTKQRIIRNIKEAEIAVGGIELLANALNLKVRTIQYWKKNRNVPAYMRYRFYSFVVDQRGLKLPINFLIKGFDR